MQTQQSARSGLAGEARVSGWDRRGLPAWAYSNPELMELEQDLLFRRHWQLACHVGDIPNTGDYVTFDVCGERALILRDRDGSVRAFHNLCRHRGSRLLSGQQGHCKNALVCPFHGWVFNFDGSLRGVAHPESLPALDKQAWGLKPVEMEIWQGFIFVRFKPGPQPSVASLLKPYEAEAAAFRSAEAQPTYGAWGMESPVNWKSVRDIDNEGYHVPMAHPGLHDLYGKHYNDEPFQNGISRSRGRFNESNGERWSVRHYRAILPEVSWLDPQYRNQWIYHSLFPNTVITFKPDGVSFYQEFPIGQRRSQLRGRCYGLPDERREMRLARYLSSRIDRDTGVEDVNLTIWSDEATQSSAYDGIILSDLERTVRSHHDALRAFFPVLNLEKAPAAGTLAERNAEMLAG